MKERRRRIIIFAALPVALVWGYYNLFIKPARTTGYAPTSEAQNAVSAATDLLSRPDSLDAAIAAIKAENWGADPFRMGSRSQVPSYSAPAAKLSEPVWQLNGIIYNETIPFAYVNSKSVKVGDKVNSATVVAIDRKSVTLEYNGGRITLSLRKGATS